MSCDTKELVIQKGKTFSRILRWETEPFIYKAITGIVKTAPARITATSHVVPDGWRVAIVSVQGMVEINAKNSPPRVTDYHKATVIDPNTIDLNDVNSSEFTTYASGGFVQYYTPVDLTGFTARMHIRASETSPTVLETLTTENGKIAIDNTLKTITLTLSATATAAYTWKSAVYDLELVSLVGVVTQLLKGPVTVEGEVTV